jgi:YVTN family beta-propeller protein
MLRPAHVSLVLLLAALATPSSAQLASRVPQAPAPKALVAPVQSTAVAPFPNFESGPVRPLLLTPDGAHLLALNTPDARLEVFTTGVDAQGVPHLQFEGAVFTGLEPVSVALHDADPNTAFVANLLSDTVTVVDIAQLAVRAVLAVGDEPMDVAVANGHLFVTTARSAEAASLTEPGTFTQNAVVVFDAAPPYALIARTELPAHRPRALAVDGGTIYVAPLNSGNHTSALNADDASQLGLAQTDVDAFDPPFTVNPTLLIPQFTGFGFINQTFGIFGWAVPVTGRIVMDSEFPALVPQLADADVLALDVLTGALLPGAATGVGSTLLAMARNPATGELWVAGTDARNRTRFEPNVKGQGFDNRITVVAPDLTVSSIVSLAPPFTATQHAQPASLAFMEGPERHYAYAATLGDDTVVVLDSVSQQLVTELLLPGGAQPLGLAADGERGLLYVLGRGDKTLHAFDADAGHAPTGRTARLSYDPEPQAVVAGRPILYGAVEDGTGNGNMSCASCHVFGHADQLAWDLGDPQGGIGYFYLDLMTGTLGFDGAKVALKGSIMTHPMKGPMVTQSLRGLQPGSAVPLHWRGDRRFIQMFRGAFSGLLGGSGLSTHDMQEFSSFVRSLSHQPNPYEPKDRVYTGTAALGRDLFGMNPQVPGKPYNVNVPGVTCIDCHTGDFAGGTNFTGAQATVNFDGESQLFNTPQLRGVYEKEFAGLTGFGTLHDGSLDDIQDFMHFEAMGMQGFPDLDEPEKQAVEDFVRAWDTGTAPLVGAQYFASAATTTLLYEWLDLAEGQAADPSHPLDLVGKGRLIVPGGAIPLGLHFTWNDALSSWLYRTDFGRWSSRGPIVAAIAAGQLEMSFTCVPPGLGERLGVDRDEDGLLDGTEVSILTDPASPDTDGDGYADGLELQLGSNAAVFDAFVPDGTPPVVQLAEAQDVFADAATLHVVSDEPASLLVEVGLAAGSYDLASFADGALRREHSLVLVELPALSTIFFRVTASDRNGNPGTFEGEFSTTAPLYRVADVTLEKSGSGTITITATALIVDQAGVPVADAPVRGLWAGPLGGGDFFPLVRTDAAGVATFTLGPYAPSADTVTFAVAYVGTNETADPFFIGFGGDAPKFFYDQSANSENGAEIAVP